MTKMEDEEMSGGDAESSSESQADVPASNQNDTPSSESGEGGAKYCGKSSPMTKGDAGSSMLCSGCKGQILDKFFMKVDGRSWHEKCVNCGNCQRVLSESCFSKNFKLFCKDCYIQLQYCHRCCGSICGDELVMRVGDDSYHVTCFLCDYCSRKLQIGDQFHSLNETASQKICCKTCYDMDDVSNLRVTDTDSEDSTSERDAFSPEIYPSSSNTPFMTSQTPSFDRQLSDYNPGPPPPAGATSFTSLMTSSNSKRTKRPRTILTTVQRKKFKASFEISQKPCRKVKKMARRQNQGDGTTRRGRRKMEDSDSESEAPSSPASCTSASTQQAQYYSDYQSPGSVQSTSTQDDNPSRVFPPSFHPYDGESSFRGLEGGSFYQRGASLPHSPSQLEMHQMLHERVGVKHDITQHRRDFVSHGEDTCESYATPWNSEIVDISHQRPLGGGVAPGTTNPIDSLMYMQSSFFNTS